MHQNQSKISPKTTAALKSSNTLLEWLQMTGWQKDFYILEPIHMRTVKSASRQLTWRIRISVIVTICNCIGKPALWCDGTQCIVVKLNNESEVVWNCHLSKKKKKWALSRLWVHAYRTSFPLLLCVMQFRKIKIKCITCMKILVLWRSLWTELQLLQCPYHWEPQ